MAQNMDSEIGIGFSDRLLVGVSIVGFTALVYVVHSLLRLSGPGRRDNDHNYDENEEERLMRGDRNLQALNRTQRRARAKAIMKEQRRLLHPSQADENHMEHDNNDNNGNNNGVDERNIDPVDVPPMLQQRLLPPPSRKERQQQAKVAEKEERRLFQDERERQQKLVQMEAQRKKKERLMAATQRLLEEELQKAKEEAASEERERDLWYNFIPTSHATRTADVTMTVSEFIQECQNHRVVNIQIMASQYQVDPSLIVDRIQQLLSDGRIAGFFRNTMNQQFIYVSDDELHSIANQARRTKGYWSVAHFATICQHTILDHSQSEPIARSTCSSSATSG